MLPDLIECEEQPLGPEMQSMASVGEETLFNGERYRCIYVAESEETGNLVTRYVRVEATG